MWIYFHLNVIGDVVRRSQATSPLLASLLAALSVTVSRCASPQNPGLFCDNGKLFLDRDLPTDAIFWRCAEPLLPESIQTVASIDKRYNLEPARRVCMGKPIYYNHSIPNSGAFRPIKAESGEYLYCPPQRWLNNLHLGAIVLLHHPCAPLRERHLLSGLARSCLPGFIISSHAQLSRHTPLALVTWGRTLELTSVSSVICDWLETAHTWINQSDDQIMKYDHLLVEPARLHRMETLDVKKMTLRRCCEETISTLLRKAKKKKQQIKIGSKRRSKRDAIKEMDDNNKPNTTDVLEVSLNKNSAALDLHSGEQTGSSHISTRSEDEASESVQQKDVKSADRGKMKGNIEEREVEHSTSHLHQKDLDLNPEPVVHSNRGFPRRPRSDEAMWAAAALGFLLVLLTLSVLHTRLYRHCRTSPGIYWHDARRDYDSVADVIRRLKIAKQRRKRGRRQECVVLPSSSSSDEFP